MNQTNQCVPFDDNQVGECPVDAILIAGVCTYKDAVAGAGAARTEAPPSQPAAGPANICEAGMMMAPSGQCVPLGVNLDAGQSGELQCADGMAMNQTNQCVPFDDNKVGECPVDAILIAGVCTYKDAVAGTGADRTEAPPPQPAAGPANICEAGMMMAPSGQCVPLGVNLNGSPTDLNDVTN